MNAGRLSIVVRIAARNLVTHRSKTIVMGTLVTAAIFAMVMGNSLLETAARSYQRSFIGAFTGNLVVAGQVKAGASLLGGGGFGGSEPPPPIADQTAILEFLSGHRLVASVSPQVLGYATASIGDEIAGFSTLFGISPEEYGQTFPESVVILDGRMLEAGETGMLLNRSLLESFYQATGELVSAGDQLVLRGLNLSVGTKIRSVPVVGVFEFSESNPNLNLISLVDAQTVRSLNGMNLSSVDPVSLTDEEQLLLAAQDDGELFGEDSLFGSTLVVPSAQSPSETSSTESGNDAPIAESTVRANGRDLAGTGTIRDQAWHYFIVRTTDEAAAIQLHRELEAYIDANDLSPTVMDWQTAAGPPGMFIGGIRLALNVAILLIVTVSVLIIMNSLVISVSERTAEIGTMRAIGAQRQFVWWMILTETVTLTGVFGVVGVSMAAITLWTLSLTGLSAPNQFFRLLFGGETLAPVLSARSVVQSLIGVAIAGIIAGVYPTFVALKVKPVVAMESK